MIYTSFHRKSCTDVGCGCMIRFVQWDLCGSDFVPIASHGQSLWEVTHVSLWVFDAPALCHEDSTSQVGDAPSVWSDGENVESNIPDLSSDPKRSHASHATDLWARTKPLWLLHRITALRDPSPQLYVQAWNSAFTVVHVSFARRTHVKQEVCC